MDVAFVSNVIYPFVKGGAEKRIHEIGRRLAADGHNVTVYGRKFWDGPSVVTHSGMTLRGVASEAELYTDDGTRSILEALTFAGQLVPALQPRVSDHDVVVASVFPYFPVLTSRVCTLLTDTPLVTTWHEVWNGYWREYLDSLAAGGIAVERLTARASDHPIAVSSVTADRLAAIGPPRDRITIVPNGIDFDRIQNAPLPQQSYRTDGEPGFDVVFAGRLIEDKNVDVLLDAFDRVAARHDISLGIIGEGPEMEALQARARRLNHADRVTFLGFLEEHHEVLGHLRAAPVFASPSTREGFGITYAEAMAAGCEVIAADHVTSAAGEVVGDAGYVVDPTVDSVSDALERALSNETTPVTSPLVRAKQFDWDSVADQATAVYRRAIKASTSAKM